MSERNQTAGELTERKHTSGKWLGELEGLRIEFVGDGPILEIHGDQAMASVEILEERFVDGLTEAAAEIQLTLDEMGGHESSESDTKSGGSE